MTLFGNKAFTEVIKLNEVIRMDSNPIGSYMTDVLIKGGIWTQRPTCREGRRHEETQEGGHVKTEDWGDASPSRGTLGVPRI